jgi:plastocyanin
MRWTPKVPLRTVVLAATAVLVSALVAGPALAQGTKTVETRGGEILNPSGQFVKINFRFQPKTISVASGSVVRWVDNDEDADEPHTVTIADQADLPSTIEQLEACYEPGALCIETIAAHDPGLDEQPPFNVVVNVGGPGLDARGDSLLFGGPFDQSVEAQVTAPAGSTLPYLCVIHPWMQGSIKVRG